MLTPEEISAVEKLGTVYYNIVLDPSTIDYLYYQSSSKRANIHNMLSEILDVDRELIQT